MSTTALYGIRQKLEAIIESFGASPILQNTREKLEGVRYDLLYLERGRLDLINLERGRLDGGGDQYMQEDERAYLFDTDTPEQKTINKRRLPDDFETENRSQQRIRLHENDSLFNEYITGKPKGVKRDWNQIVANDLERGTINIINEALSKKPKREKY